VKRSLVRLLACPHCRSSLVLPADPARDGADFGSPGEAGAAGTAGEVADVAEAGEVALAAAAGEIDAGELRCSGCDRRYPIVGGIPSFVPAQDRSSHVAASFGFEWQMFHDGGFERNTVFGRTIDEDVAQFDEVFGLDRPPAGAGLPGAGIPSGAGVPASAEEDPLAGLVVVDAGCGSGKLTAEIARRHPAATVLGLDINPAIHEVYKASLDLPNLHVVQASVFDLPFADGTVDRLWCNGVIHHTGDTRRAFRSLARGVRPGGLLFVWVYQRKLSPLVLVRDLLGPFGLHRWSHRTLYRLCRVLSLPTFAAVRLLHLLGRVPAVRRSTHGRILTRDRHYDELTLTWFDVLSPRYRDTYRKSEVEAWYRAAGYGELRHYWWPVGVTGRRG
jgi:SAM-dependent methyltransferase